MPIKVKIGHLQGTREQFTVGITAFETSGGILGFQDAIDAVIAARPATMLTLVANDETLALKDRSDKIIQFELTYENEEADDNRPPKPVATGEKIRRAACVAKSVRRSTFLESIGVYGPDGANITADYVGLKWKIDVLGQGSHYQNAQEHVFEPLAETQHIDFYPAKALVTDAWLNNIENLVSRGCFNGSLFRTRAIGTVQLVRFNAVERNRDDWEFSFGFGYKPIETGVSVSDNITIPTVRGCDYHWERDEQHYDDTKKILQNRTKFSVLGQVWELGDFSVLNIPA